MALVSVPVAGAIVSVPSVPVGIVALAIPFASNTDPAVTAPATAPDINRINTLFSYTIQLTFTEEMGPNRRHNADGTAVRDRAETMLHNRLPAGAERSRRLQGGTGAKGPIRRRNPRRFGWS
ncbi:MAG: hypothetical protein WBV74_01580 [Pseudonocardiaceae bacterium]